MSSEERHAVQASDVPAPTDRTKFSMGQIFAGAVLGSVITAFILHPRVDDASTKQARDAHALVVDTLDVVESCQKNLETARKEQKELVASIGKDQLASQAIISAFAAASREEPDVLRVNTTPEGLSVSVGNVTCHATYDGQSEGCRRTNAGPRTRAGF